VNDAVRFVSPFNSRKPNEAKVKVKENSLVVMLKY
jgi:hypothetical protein